MDGVALRGIEAGIALLADEVVARIAAGESIERPASAVKELIENAIDAGATSIHIETRAGGRLLLRVADNGCGIRGDEIALALRRHATSKLRGSDDLERIATLGFRGEALASIAAVSRTTLTTRHRDETMGASARVIGGEIQRLKAIGAPAGTVVAVENLFFNTPARLKFLKADRTEKRQIYSVASNYALAYPAIAFSLTQDGREQFRSGGGGDLADVAAAVFGREHFKHMIAVGGDESGGLRGAKIGLRGYTSLPQLTRSDRSRIIIFVNGRAVRDSSLSHAVIQAYAGLIKAGSYPLAALLITLPVEAVDVNVHPTKAQVRFRDPNRVFAATQRAVRLALQNSDLARPAAEDPWSENGHAGPMAEAWRRDPAWHGGNGDALFDDADLPFIPADSETPAQPRTLPVLRVVGQVGATYIVAEGPAGLYLIDQNAAHERVLMEELSAQGRNGGVVSLRPAESPMALLSPEDSALLQELGAGLDRLGFEIEPFGPNAYVLRALPACLAGLPMPEALELMLDQLRGGPGEDKDLLAALAAAGAAKRGQILDADEMLALVARLERCPTPTHSPSGRATLIHLTREQLADEFRRG